MAEQLDMFGTPPAAPKETERAKPEPEPPPEPEVTAGAFEAFHAANPHVLAEMLRLAHAQLDKGSKYISAKWLWEDLRSWLRTTGQPYKLNNNLTAAYARKLVELEPRLEGVIRFRGGDK